MLHFFLYFQDHKEFLVASLKIIKSPKSFCYTYLLCLRARGATVLVWRSKDPVENGSFSLRSSAWWLACYRLSHLAGPALGILVLKQWAVLLNVKDKTWSILLPCSSTCSMHNFTNFGTVPFSLWHRLARLDPNTWSERDFLNVSHCWTSVQKTAKFFSMHTRASSNLTSIFPNKQTLRLQFTLAEKALCFYSSCREHGP